PRPATQSSQKWLPVAITANHTQAGQTIQKSFAHQRRQRIASTVPTINESAAWRLGIAAYGLAASWTTPSGCEAAKPTPSMRGGAIGMKTYPIRPSTLASRIVLRNRMKAG